MKEADFNEIVSSIAKIHELGISQLSAYERGRGNAGVQRDRSFIQIKGVWLPYHVGIGRMLSDPEVFFFDNVKQNRF